MRIQKMCYLASLQFLHTSGFCVKDLCAPVQLFLKYCSIFPHFKRAQLIVRCFVRSDATSHGARAVCRFVVLYFKRNGKCNRLCMKVAMATTWVRLLQLSKYTEETKMWGQSENGYFAFRSISFFVALQAADHSPVEIVFETTSNIENVPARGSLQVTVEELAKWRPSFYLFFASYDHGKYIRYSSVSFLIYDSMIFIVSVNVEQGKKPELCLDESP